MLLAATMLPAGLLAQQVNRSAPPQLGPPPTLHIPPVTERALPNGIRLLVAERHELPIADFVLLVPSANASANPATQAGIAGLTADMLTNGTTTRSALQIADQAAFLGIQLSAGSGWDATLVSLTTPTAQLDSALALFADVALHPTFPDSEWARVKKDRLTELLQLKDRGPAIASRVYPAILFGSESPYGRPAAGTEQSVGAMTSGDLRAFYKSRFVPNGSTIIAVGDVTPADIEARLGRLFGGWPRAVVAPIVVPAAPAPGATTIYLVDKPGAAQSSFRVGNIGVARATPDYFPITVMNTALGGSFTSRLNMDLRERHGYTYGAFSSFDMRRYPGPFTASAEVVSAKTDSALITFLADLRSIRDTLPQPELTKTRRYIELGLPATFETTGQIAAHLANVALYGLPLDYYNQLVPRIDAVTQTDALAAARRYIDPAHLTIVIVGDRKSIEAPLRALKVAPVEIRDITGAPVK